MITESKDIWALTIAGIPVLYGLWKIVINPMLRRTRNIRKALESLVDINERLSVVAQLRAELHPNGGSSLRDAIDRVEQGVNETNQAQRAILDLLNAAFFISDPHGKCTHVNRYWQELTGMTPDESLGSGWTNAIHPLDRRNIQKEWEACVRDGRSFSAHYRVCNKVTNRIVWVYGRSVALRDTDGRIFGHIGTLFEDDPV